MSPIECGAFRADEDEARSFSLGLVWPDSIDITLYGYQNGGKAVYTFKVLGLGVHSSSLEVKTGEEIEILDTGIRVKGSETDI